MCRITTTATENHHLRRLRINSFYLRLALSSSVADDLLPDSLTLVLLPRVNAASLSVNGSKVPSNSPAFLSLHRVLSPDDDAVFVTRDRLRASDGLSFEIHAADYRLLKGVVYHDGDCDDAWRIDNNFNCASFDGGSFNDNVTEAEISVALEDGSVMRERVTMEAAARRMRRRRRRCRLEDIPEEEYSSECCCCCDDVSSSDSDGEDEFEIDSVVDHQEDGKKTEMEIGEGVRWAADVGFWVMCFSVGYLVSRASRRLRPRKLLP